MMRLSSGIAWEYVVSLVLAYAVGLHRRRRKRNEQALCDVASIGDLAGVKRMLADGVDENSADEDGTTALMAAAFAGQAAVVRLLLKSGADTDLQDESGLTALMNAVIADGEMDLEGGHPVFAEIIRLLLEAGADVDLQDEDGLSAGDHAEAYQLLEIADLLARS